MPYALTSTTGVYKCFSFKLNYVSNEMEYSAQYRMYKSRSQNRSDCLYVWLDKSILLLARRLRTRFGITLNLPKQNTYQALHEEYCSPL